MPRHLQELYQRLVTTACSGNSTPRKESHEQQSYQELTFRPGLQQQYEHHNHTHADVCYPSSGEDSPAHMYQQHPGMSPSSGGGRYGSPARPQGRYDDHACIDRSDNKRQVRTQQHESIVTITILMKLSWVCFMNVMGNRLFLMITHTRKFQKRKKLGIPVDVFNLCYGPTMMCRLPPLVLVLLLAGWTWHPQDTAQSCRQHHQGGKPGPHVLVS